ncbi:HYR-like domain-containing protein, partial [Flavobacterium restrictum]
TTVTAQCSVASITAPTATDNCSGTITGTTTTTFPITTQGTTTVIWKYADAKGNTATQNQTVTITDTLAPVANAATLTTVTAQCSVASITAPTANDNCSGTITGTTTTTFPIATQGTTTVVWTYADAKGNTATQNQTVTITDTVAPVANAATLTTVTAQCSVASITAPTATDNCSGTITGTTTTTFPIATQGTTTVTWTYADAKGNTSTQNQTVTITDTVAPVTPTLADIKSDCSATAVAPTTTDACAGTLTGTTSDALTYNTAGTHVIHWTFNDGHGQSIIVPQNVIIAIPAATPTTAIPDANFEQALIDLGYDCLKDGKVITSNISGITTLDVNTKNISDLTGIKAFSNLQTLGCDTNNLTSLDLTGLTHLTELNCYYNALTSLDLSSLTSLTYLDCGNNNIQSLDLTGLTALTYVYAGYNNLTTLNVTDLNTSAELYCYNNADLTCIATTDPAAATANSLWQKDAAANYVTNNPILIGGAVTGGTPICLGSASGLLSLTGATGTILRWESAVSPFTTWTPIAHTNTTYTAGILTQTTQFRAVLINSLCATTTATPTTVTIESTTWTGTWSNGTPNANKGAIIAADFTATANLAACSLVVNNNAKVLVKSGFNFSIANDVTVATGSTLTFENNTNLVQSKDTNGNTGNIIVKRKTSPLMLLDYVIWSAPVANQKLQAFSPATLATRFYTYNPTTNLYNAIATPSTTNFATATGYLIRLPNNHPTTPTIWEGQFEGTPNNGNYTFAVANNTYNAIGNPYPSTLSADAFIDTNAITDALYFWRKTNNTATTSYATYTKAGGTANAGGASSIVPNGIIQVGQGFLTKPTAATISFTNAMRVTNNANQFLKTKAIERNRIWLNLAKDTAPVNQIMVAYMTGASSGIDPAIDGHFINDNSTALTSTINNEEFAIQGRSLPFSDTDLVPLTFKTNASGTFSIAIDHVDGLFEGNQDVFVNDKLIGTSQNLKKAPYAFTSATGTFSNRFELAYKSSLALGVQKPEFTSNSIIVFKQNGLITINAGKAIIKNVRLFDIRGRMIYEQNNIKLNTTVLKDFTAAEQTIMVQITSDLNEIVTKKIIY